MNVDQYYKDMGAMQSKVPKAKRAPGLPAMHDYQFWPKQRILELHEKEQKWFEEQKKKGEDEEDGTTNGLSPEEVEEKKALEEQAFRKWKKSEFVAFCRACAEYGRENFEAIAEDIQEKSEEDVRDYAAVFWERCEELHEWARIKERIDKGEAKIRRRQEIERVLATAIQECPYNPWQNLQIKYTPGSRGKQYSDDEDRYLICMTHQLGYGKWDELKMEIRNSWEFRFDWFLKSRTPAELGRRVDVLLRLLEKEKAKGAGDKKRKSGGNDQVKEKKRKP
uniref:SANT domain-containing protein n=2 Tax=Palpitomonas bilix TaxID=652834 RepID=A0A7S3DI44_9EUKA|mmetsp:Transcript_38019/g.98151  ORF Transcript_38019/g.98151 Transcript_38019/m.98151 type:complete len:279 (+) Transcript_38019:1513-2349(+)